MKLKILNISNLFISLSILGVYLTVSNVISPFLHYHLQQTAFVTGSDFFDNFTHYPGGIAAYFAEFIAQFFYFNAFGSFLIVAIASLQGFIALAVVNLLIGNIKLRYSVFALILLFGVVVLFNYRYPYYASVRLLFAFIFTWVFCLLNKRYPKQSAFFWFIFSGILFYVAGGPSLFVFCLSTAFIFLITNKQLLRLLFIPVFLLFAGLLPYLGYKFIFQMSLHNLYAITLEKPPAMLSYTPEISIYIYYLLLPAILLGALFFSKLHEKAANPQIKAEKTILNISFFRTTFFIVSLQLFALFGLGYFLYIKFYNPFIKSLITIEYYAEHEQWGELLKTTKNIKQYDFRVNFQGSRALSHLGKLPDRLFEYPQLLGTYGLFIDATMARSATMSTSDLYFDLGYMSESQHWAYETQTLLPNSPRILKRLVIINLVNRKYNLAKKFLNILDKNMLYHDWVRKYERYVSDTTLASKDNVIAEKRLFSPQKVAINTGNEDCLKLLVETNPNNRMAYDYLLCFYLLDLNFPKFVEYLTYYKDYNIKKLPGPWEEALTIYIVKTKSIPESFSPDIISKDCVRRFTDFTDRIGKVKNNLAAAKSTLYKDYGNTYWYYMFYLSPKVTNVLINKTEVQ
jgi:hypothetical protein